MNYKIRIWDKASPINGCPADKALTSLKLKPEDQVYILQDADTDRDYILQTQANAPYPGDTIEQSAQNHIDHLIAEEQAAAEEAAKPKLEDRVAALEQAQLAALGV